MITLTHYRKFIERRPGQLKWSWNSVQKVKFGNTRFYRAVVSDGVRHRILRRKCHTAEDALRYGARMTQRVNGFTDVNHSALAEMNSMVAVR